MVRIASVLMVIAALAACDDGKAKAKAAIDKVDKSLDKLDQGEASRNLASAREAMAAGREPVAECSWVNSPGAGGGPEVAELGKLCSVEVPLAVATRAVSRAEQARAELPDAPSLTECSSDDWAKAERRMRVNASDPRWTELQARWARACPSP